ncbi:hypothetical protein LCGC14_0720020 [marine sediment metagenome]|uniref:SAC domain-containing protein n=1 Tax=marine sediment metagenome TaxID=412755 RepID=A0A0F9SY32_9ZZZZ
MKQENIIYVVNFAATRLTLNPFAKTLPILWCQDGEYRVFPKEILSNARDASNLYADHYSDKANDKKIEYSCICWEQGMPVDNLVGRALSGE